MAKHLEQKGKALPSINYTFNACYVRMTSYRFEVSLRFLSL